MSLSAVGEEPNHHIGDKHCPECWEDPERGLGQSPSRSCLALLDDGRQVGWIIPQMLGDIDVRFPP